MHVTVYESGENNESPGIYYLFGAQIFFNFDYFSARDPYVRLYYSGFRDYRTVFDAKIHVVVI